MDMMKPLETGALVVNVRIFNYDQWHVLGRRDDIQTLLFPNFISSLIPRGLEVLFHPVPGLQCSPPGVLRAQLK
jgi:hypothetical protein